MGASMGKLKIYQQTVTQNLKSYVRMKRKITEVDEGDPFCNSDDAEPPIKKKKLCPLEAVYEELFLKGVSSDYTVVALGKSWNLHKIYLTQSPYFESMFSGSWKETNENKIKIPILDPNITVESLHSVLGSLYKYEVELEPCKVISTLATAMLFQLDSLIEQCSNIMVKTVNFRTAVQYYEVGVQYGLTEVQNAAFNWLLVNLMISVWKNLVTLKEISIELMTKLVASPELMVIYSEKAVYDLLKVWVYLQVTPTSIWLDLTPNKIIKLLKTMPRRDRSMSYLETDEGKCYLPVFQALRLSHVLEDMFGVKTVEEDNVIPQTTVRRVKYHLWKTLLRVNNTIDLGSQLTSVTEDQFLKHALRWGCQLAHMGSEDWIWPLFLYGARLLWRVVGNRAVTVKVVAPAQGGPTYVPQKIKLMMRLKVMSVDSQGHVTYSRCSDIMTYTIPSQGMVVWNVERASDPRLMLQVHLLLVAPLESAPTNNSAVQSVPNNRSLPSGDH
uniref:(California timema) hypothetical protein n=1 Tax=Timema californicum TaxID=61474 RepID=A0A7R9IXK1_TIMCA|nr:unnamed protein product [Timema californicum]